MENINYHGMQITAKEREITLSCWFYQYPPEHVKSIIYYMRENSVDWITRDQLSDFYEGAEFNN